MKIRVWHDRVETTRPGDKNRTYRPGKKHAAVEVKVPLWLVPILRRFEKVTRA